MDEDRTIPDGDEQRVVVIRTAPDERAERTGIDDRAARRLGRVEAHATSGTSRPGRRPLVRVLAVLLALLVMAVLVWGGLVLLGIA